MAAEAVDLAVGLVADRFRSSLRALSERAVFRAADSGGDVLVSRLVPCARRIFLQRRFHQHLQGGFDLCLAGDSAGVLLSRRLCLLGVFLLAADFHSFLVAEHDGVSRLSDRLAKLANVLPPPPYQRHSDSDRWLERRS